MFGNFGREQPLESLRREERNNVNMNLRELGCEGGRWMGSGS